MSNAEFYRSLPAKRMGAGVILMNQAGEILVLEPTYKPTWEIPGGIVEANESPRAAASRESMEETGLNIPEESLDLAAIEYMAMGGEKTEALMFVFNGGVLNDQQISRIAVDGAEIRSFRFLAPEIAAPLLGEILGKRVLRAVSARRDGTEIYFEGRYSE
jgi:ADP-ribose pyrophosphatase YjhB (NUDIX family)